jgi:glycosyltransferase involved in cell wall biosynthesis
MARSKVEPTVVHINNHLKVVFTHFLDKLVIREILLADVIQFENSDYSPVMIPLRLLGKRFVLDEHDVEIEHRKELKRIQPLLGKKRSFSPFQFVKSSTPIVLALNKLAVKFSSMVLTCSNRDAIQIQRLYGLNKDKLRVVPNCADPEYFDRVKPYRFVHPVVLFVGNFDHPPNVEGAIVLLRRIMPLVRMKRSDVTVVLVGKNPPLNLVNENDKNVIFTGEVDDLRPLIMGADVAVAPIFAGSGTRQKIVDYMALGKPIVSTAKGAEGLRLQNERHFLERDTVEGFSRAILELLEDPEKAKLLGNEARRLARAEYAWDVQIHKVLAAYERVLEARR